MNPTEDEKNEGRHCLLAIPEGPEFQAVRKAVERGVTEAGLRADFLGQESQERVLAELSRAVCVVADLTGNTPDVLSKIGMANALGRLLLLLVRRGQEPIIPSGLIIGFQLFAYDLTPGGLDGLSSKIFRALLRYQGRPRRNTVLDPRSTASFVVDWNQLERAEAENLCRELLVQMGFKRVDWEKRSREVDLVAELPRKDPDGFEYTELWLVAMGRNAPLERVADMAIEDPSFVARRFIRDEYRVGLRSNESDRPITLLIIALEAGPHSDELKRLMRRSQVEGLKRAPYSLRIRLWDRDYLASLVQQFPQLGYKYFSDEGRARSKYRKTPEELYRENVDLAERQAKLIADLTEERNKRARAERDAIWKDISFSAAHKIGNPIFAIETNLDPLQKRVVENRLDEALAVISRVRVSVEKAKGIVEQFKSLTRAQKIRPVPTPLRPILEDACRTAREKEVACEINCPEGLRVHGDPERLSECFDELVANSLHWLDRPERRIQVEVTQPAPPPLPDGLDAIREYTLIHFRDNGHGVPVSNKARIFDAFFTTQEHGTGLGLALVRRIVEGHGGAIIETGIPGEGAEFEIYLPSALGSGQKPSTLTKRRRKPKIEVV